MEWGYSEYPHFVSPQKGTTLNQYHPQLRDSLRTTLYPPEMSEAEVYEYLHVTPLAVDPDFTSPRGAVARALDEFDVDHTFRKKAIRHDECNQFIFRDLCKAGHISVRTSYCQLGICATCALIRMQQLLDKFAHVQGVLLRETPDLSATYLEFSLPCDDATPTATTTAILSRLLSLLPDDGEALKAFHAHRDTGILLWSYIGGMKDSRLIFRVMLAYPFPPLTRAAILAEFSNLSIRPIISTFHLTEMERFFRFLLKPIIPDAPVEAAKMEVLLHRVRRLRVLGDVTSPTVNSIPDDCGDSRTTEPRCTDNSAGENAELEPEESDSLPPEPHKGRKCRCCGAPIVSSERIFLDDTLKSDKKPA